MDETLSRDGREGLRALMERASRPMYVRALQLTGDVRDAKQAVRRALNEAAKAAKSGALPEEAEAWCLQLVERFCDDELYYKRLIDDTMAGLDAPFTAPCAAAEKESVPFAPESAPAYASAAVLPKRAEPRAQAMALAADGDEGMFAAPKKQREKAVPNLFAEDDEGCDEPDDDEYDDDYRQKTGGFGLALLILLLTLISAGLIWIIAVKLKTLGYINISDFGFASWFNENIFMFY